MEGLDRLQVDAFSSIPERAHLIEANALQIAIGRHLRRDGETEVRGPGDRRLGLPQAAQPERGPSDKILWAQKHQRYAVGKTEEEIVDQTHIVVERRPVKADVISAQFHRRYHAVQRRQHASLLPNANSRKPGGPRGELQRRDLLASRRDKRHRPSAGAAQLGLAEQEAGIALRLFQTLAHARQRLVTHCDPRVRLLKCADQDVEQAGLASLQDRRSD